MSYPAEQFRLDPRLLSPKLEDLAAEMHERIVEAERRIGFEVSQSGNAAGYLPRLFDFHEQLTDEWARRCYEAHCETWKEQNRSVTPAFTRWVRGKAIIPMIATRKGSVLSEVRRRATATGREAGGVAIGSWNRRMNRLAIRWNRKLEAEAVAGEYRSVQPQREGRVAPPSSSLPESAQKAAQRATPDADAWREFRAGFDALRKEESSSDIPHGKDRWVLAYSQGEMTEWYVSGGGREPPCGVGGIGSACGS